MKNNLTFLALLLVLFSIDYNWDLKSIKYLFNPDLIAINWNDTAKVPKSRRFFGVNPFSRGRW